MPDGLKDWHGNSFPAFMLSRYNLLSALCTAQDCFPVALQGIERCASEPLLWPTKQQVSSLCQIFMLFLVIVSQDLESLQEFPLWRHLTHRWVSLLYFARFYWFGFFEKPANIYLMTTVLQEGSSCPFLCLHCLSLRAVLCFVSRIHLFTDYTYELSPFSKQ